MKKVKLLLATLLTIGLMAMVVVPALAQSQDLVTAQVDRTRLTTDETLYLTVSIDQSAGNASEPVLPAMDGFAVLGSSRGTQMTFINGDLSVQATYRYVLQPTQAGDLVIGPISVSMNGNAYNTSPITVQVSQGTGVPQPANPPSSLFSSIPNLLNMPNFPSLPSVPAAPSQPTVPVDPAATPAELAGQDFFVEAEVDNLRPFQGQQLTYTLRFYQAVSLLGQSSYEPPPFTGFWSEAAPEQGEYTIHAAGRNYQVTEVKTVLFPTVIGKVIIDPASLSIPGDLFSRGAVLQTQPITVDVQPLPDGAPPSFQGAVGRFEIQASVDTPQTQVNDTLTWRVVISGEGNFETLPDPQWPESADWRAFDSQAKVDSRLEGGLMVGSRAYDRVLVPTAAGNITLPAIEYSYFDPQQVEYVTVHSELLDVFVAPDEGETFTAPTLPSGNSAASGPVGGISPDIRPLKEAPATWAIGDQLLTQKAGYWLLWFIPLAILVGQFARRQWQLSRRNNVTTRRSQQAAKKARQALRQAARVPETAYDAAGRVLTDYLSAKLDQSIAGLTHDSLAELLRAKGLQNNLVEQVQNCLALSEMGRYAPGDAGAAQGGILKEMDRLIGEIEKSL